MLTKTETAGLCMTCNNSPTCYYFRSRGPAQFCDLFDDYVTPERKFSFTLEEEHEQLADETFTGLCMNCEHRRECHHPKPETGIWHCNDYA